MRAALLLSSSHIVLLYFVSFATSASADATTIAHSSTVSTSATASPSSRIYQPILQPNSSTVLTPGTKFLIQWTPDTRFKNITLELWDRTSWGYSRDFGSFCYHYLNPFCGSLGLDLPNTGNFSWPIPVPQNGFPRNDRSFWIKMYVNDFSRPEIGNTEPVVSFSQSFAFESADGTGWVSSTPPVWAMMPTAINSIDPAGTIFVTVHDKSAAASNPVAAATGLAMVSGLEKTNRGAALRSGKSWASVLGIIVGIL